MSDTSYWTCPECGEAISGEAVVDPTFLERVAEHVLRRHYGYDRARELVGDDFVDGWLHAQEGP